MAEASTRVLGRLLLLSGAVGVPELADALDEQRRTRERLGTVLVRRGVEPEQVARALAQQLRLPYADAPLRPDPAALRLVETGLATRVRAVPLALTKGGLRVAMADPLDVVAVDDLQFQTGRRVEPVVATPAAVDEALAAVYGPAVEEVRGRGPGGGNGIGGGEDTGAPQAGEPGEVGELRRASEAPSIIALVDRVLDRGFRVRASDIHIEPTASGLRVRARVDGWLRDLMMLPESAALAVVSRIKIMAGLDISVKLRPQDGRCAIRLAGRELWLRVSTLPSAGGEKVVLRLLEPDNAGGRLEDLGFGEALRDRIGRVLARTHGAFLVTGPTGSGKTTTLYAAIAALDRERRNVITLEDPIEYRLPRITQVQVNPRAGLGFAAALRSVLRQDPDAIMVGELRDRETVEVGMAAAVTGHLVLSTLHTNDAAGAVTRLTEMGAPGYLVAGGLIAVLAQRLVRRLCTACREPGEANPEELAALGLPPGPHALYRPVGCGRCGETGYRGRSGIFELLVVDARIRELIHRRATADAFREAGRAAGMVPLAHDAWTKVRSGATSLAEVRPILLGLADEAPVCAGCGADIGPDYLVCPLCGRRIRRRCVCGAALEARWCWCAACGRAAPADSPNAGPAGLGRGPDSAAERRRPEPASPVVGYSG